MPYIAQSQPRRACSCIPTGMYLIRHIPFFFPAPSLPVPPSIPFRPPLPLSLP